MTKQLELNLNTKENTTKLNVSIEKTHEEQQKEVYGLSLYVDLLDYDYLQRCA